LLANERLFWFYIDKKNNELYSPMISTSKPDRSFARALLYTIGFNTVIALFDTVMDYGGNLVENFILSQCIGLSILSGVWFVLHRFQAMKPLQLSVFVVTAMLVAIFLGTSLGVMISGMGADDFLQNSGTLMRTLVLGLLFGFIITYFFISREKIAAAETQANEEKIRRLVSEKAAAEAQVKQLQAQIEPHFLFNTLSNVLSMLDSDPENGKTMLMDFIRYLRMSLMKIREDTTTIEMEMEMIRAYLDICKVRMGKRLSYAIDLPQHLKQVSLPPMLLQPLVENAVKHGLEPKINGGEIDIGISEENGILRIHVRDSGLGFVSGYRTGMGIANIKERLKSLYDDRARLVLKELQPCGVEAILEVPHDRHSGDHS
jgi:sensor histidine kinase YesM